MGKVGSLILKITLGLLAAANFTVCIITTDPRVLVVVNVIVLALCLAAAGAGRERQPRGRERPSRRSSGPRACRPTGGA